MANEELHTADDYDRFLTARLRALGPEQRTALAAAMGERWYPAYESFSREEEWGDPTALRRSLDAVWDHLRGRPLAAADRRRLSAAIDEATPHMDDFDAEEALSAAAMVGAALDCCATADNEGHAYNAMVSAFNAVAPAWFMDEEQQPRLWRQARVQKEVRKKLQLIDRVAAVSRFDGEAIDALRHGLTARDMIGEVRPRPKAKGPTLLSNKTLFEQYRRAVEADLKGGRWRPDVDDSPEMFLIDLLAAWSGRYSRRKQAIDGSSGRPSDVLGQRAVVARNQAHDAAETRDAQWPAGVRESLEWSFSAGHLGLDVRSPDAPHGYGPSLRRLWTEARQRGASDREALDHVDAWGSRRPAAWDAEDRRRRKSSPEAKAAAALGEKLARAVTWDDTGDADSPWAASVDGQRWQVRINDFPDEPMYSLVIDGAVAGDFHDWPESWER